MDIMIGEHHAWWRDSWAIPGAVVDLWETTDQPTNSIFRTGLVVTVRTGQEIAAAPFFPWGSVYGYAVVAEPASDPLGRFREAMRQEHARHEDRESNVHFSQR